MPPVVIRPKALDDLAEIWDLARHPLIGRARPELLTDLRSLPFGRYVIFYLPRKRGIEVVRVLHGARDLKPLFDEDV